MGAILSVAGAAVHAHSSYRCHAHCCSFNLGQRRCSNTADDAHSVWLQQMMLGIILIAAVWLGVATVRSCVTTAERPQSALW